MRSATCSTGPPTSRRPRLRCRRHSVIDEVLRQVGHHSDIKTPNFPPECDGMIVQSPPWRVVWKMVPAHPRERAVVTRNLPTSGPHRSGDGSLAGERRGTRTPGPRNPVCPYGEH